MAAQDWYAHKVGGTSGIGGGTAGPWYRVLAIASNGSGGSAEHDYVTILPAALNAAMHRRPFIAGWLSRGGGAPLELITNAGPLPAAALADGPAQRPQDAAPEQPAAPQQPAQPAPPPVPPPANAPAPPPDYVMSESAEPAPVSCAPAPDTR